MSASQLSGVSAIGSSSPGAGSWPSRLWRLLVARTGFWRALIEMTVLGNSLTLLIYPLVPSVGQATSGVLSLLSLSIYGLAAWRLAPSGGGLPRQGARVLAWVLLLGVLNGVIGWVLQTFLPYQSRFLGIRPEDLHMPLGIFVLSGMLLTISIFAPVRILVALWIAGRRRLRWQLTFSYLLVGVLTTLFILFTLLAFAGISSLSFAPPIAAPAENAQRATLALTPLVRHGIAPDQLNGVLQGMLDGNTRLPMAASSADESSALLPTFGGTRRLTLLRPDGVVLASAGKDAFSAGAPLPAGDAMHTALLVEHVRAGSGCLAGRPADGQLADSAVCAISDERGALIAMMLVEQDTDSAVQVGALVGRIILIVFLGASAVLTTLLIVILVILPLAFGVGYMLARYLTGRLERLAVATAGLASGNPAGRVKVDSTDEIGRLSADFNAMADRLEQREHALAETAERAEALLQTNRRLTANVSHELRTPLATLRGYLEALEQDHGDKLPAHDMAVIHSEMQRLTGLIDDLFTLARAEAQQLPLTIEAVDPKALVLRLVDTLAPLARRERQIEIVAALPDELPQVLADRGRLEQVLLNLAQNALRHTPPGGIVAFEGAARDGMVTLGVADTGVGIAPDELSLVFERFYRGDSSRARETGGAGLGLALVRELVVAMGGSVVTESTPGRGSRFSVTLRRPDNPSEAAF